jgi:PAS domain S-box-containing protein
LTLTRKTVVTVVAVMALVAVAVSVSFWSLDRIDNAADARRHSYAVIIGGNAVLSDLRDAEIGQRGYSLTGDEAYLEPYLAVRDRVGGRLQQLRDLVPEGASRQQLDALVPLVTAKLAEMAHIIDLRRNADLPAVLAVVNRGQSRLLMNSIRVHMGDFLRIEESQLLQNEETFQSTMRVLFGVLVVTSLLTFIAAASFAWMAYRDARHRISKLVHIETAHLLAKQEETNCQLQEVNDIMRISEERLAVTLNSIGDAVIATDAEARVVIMNPLAEQLTGWPRAEGIGRPVEEIFKIINEATRLPSQVPVKGALEHGTIQGLANHTVLVARDGSECAIADSCAPIRADSGPVVGAVLVFRNVTEVRRLDRALQNKNTDLAQAIVVADRANHAKSDFLSNMSHELRTPLSAILGFAQLIESGVPAPTPAQKKSLDQILQAGWYLLELINEILDLALIESGKLSLSLEPTSLLEVMRECQAMIGPQAQRRGIAVTFPNFNVPYFVRADRMRVKQILINLLSNAIKYNRPDGKVKVDYSADATGHIRIFVRDAGAGLNTAQLSQLFEPFNRLGQGAGSEEGTGIGLVVCKQLAQQMGGRMGVESAVGTGSVFWVELQLTVDPRHDGDKTSQLPAFRPAARNDGHVYTLLYVEDNPANLLLVENLIERRPDIHLLSALDGLTGVAIARASLPDVILMDINLPGINGIEALALLAKDPATSHIPVIALSANAMPRDIEKGLAAGFYRYLTKPIKVDEFMDTLDIALKSTRPDPTPVPDPSPEPA